jgi:hypothetical protein
MGKEEETESSKEPFRRQADGGGRVQGDVPAHYERGE